MKLPLPPRRELLFAAFAILVLVAIGIAIGGDFGMSLDESGHIAYAQETVEIYQGRHSINNTAVDPSQHGPFYSFISYLGGRLVTRLRPGWLLTDGMHFMYYLSFVMAVAFLWILLRRYVGPFAAWTVSAAFYAQPLLFGHSFINPKDIPFMSLLLGCLVLGVTAVPNNPDRAAGWARAPGTQDSSAGATTISGAAWGKVWLGVLTVLAMLVIFGLWLWAGLLPSAQKLLEMAYRGQAPFFIELPFRIIATDAWKTPLSMYSAKLGSAFVLSRYGVSASLGFGALLAWGVVLTRGRNATPWSVKGCLIAAGSGIMLGLATSVRSVAPWALLPIVLIYAIRFRKYAPLYAIVLVVSGAISCVATWPFLWVNPIGHFLESVAVLSKFPWTGTILFNGQLYAQGQQPWYYIPELMGLQLTIPVLLLALVGLVGLWRVIPDIDRRAEILLILLTLGVPVVASFQAGTVVYNNFRQFLFTVPGLFLLAGLGLDYLAQRVPSARWRLLGAAVIILPGVVGIIRLHPYEYVYYNFLAGSGSSVTSRFDADYWCTSYREAMNLVNRQADHGGRIMFGPSGVTAQLTLTAREDLKLSHLETTSPSKTPSLAIICNSQNDVVDYFNNAPTVVTIERAGMIMAEVKAVRP